MYRRRIVLSAAFASAAATSLVIHQRSYHPSSSIAIAEPRPTATLANSSGKEPQFDVDSPLFQRAPSPPSVSLERILPPRSSPYLVPVSVVVITRHGARTPVYYADGQSKEQFQALWGKCHRIDSAGKHEREATTTPAKEGGAQWCELPRLDQAPEDEEALFPCERGQLTQNGERQMYAIGQALRKQYVEQDHLLPPTLTSPSLLYLRSTNMSRTRLSTARLIQGVYPSLTLSEVRAMTEVRYEHVEDLYPIYRWCDRLREIFHGAARMPLYREFLDTPGLQSFHEQAVSILTSAPFDPKRTSFPNRSWIAMSDEIKCRQGEGLPLQRGVTPQVATRINLAAEFLFHSLLKAGEHSMEQRPEHERRLLNDRSSLYNENLRLAIGRFINSLLPPFRAALDPKSRPSAPRLLAFGGHDSSIVPILAALGLDSAMQGHWPPFASYIVIELLEDRRRGGNAQVRLVYNGQEIGLMDFNEFERRADNVRVNDWERECRPRGKGVVPPQVW